MRSTMALSRLRLAGNTLESRHGISITCAGHTAYKHPSRRRAIAHSSKAEAASDSVAQDTSSSSSPPTSSQRSIAVLGAGLSGLAHALYLARSLKGHKIVVYDAAKKAGGWIQSERVRLDEASQQAGKEITALLETGPRSARMADVPGLAMLELVASLNLGDEIISTSKSAPASKNRYLYRGGKLHKIPTSLSEIASTMIIPSAHPFRKMGFFSLLTSAARRAVDREALPSFSKWQDESIENFITRHFAAPGKGPEETTSSTPSDESPSYPSLAAIDYGMSAMYHGIYAADVSQLSVRTVLPSLYRAAYELEHPMLIGLPEKVRIRQSKLYKSLSRRASEGDQFAKVESTISQRRADWMKDLQKRLGSKLLEVFSKTSTLSFRNGMQTLVDTLTRECQKLGVEFQMGQDIKKLVVGPKSAMIKRGTGDEVYHRVVAALPSGKLDTLLTGTKTQLPNLTANKVATVCVVNVAIPSTVPLKIPEAFGFLVPRICAKEGDNPAGLLGVIFDSSAVPGQDECTKLTMMFGGPYWRPGYEAYDTIQTREDKEGFLQRALGLLSYLVSIPYAVLQSPGTIKRLQVQHDCIPTYGPGHLGRMNELHEAISQKNAASLSVLGASYTGVSVNDCVLYAEQTAHRIIEAEKSNEQHKAVTGLEDILGE